MDNNWQLNSIFPLGLSQEFQAPVSDFIFDGVNKIISVKTGVTTISVRDLWSRWVDWLLTSDNSKYQIALTNVGGEDISLADGTKIPIYAFLNNGWRLRPQEANHTLNVVDGILLVSGGGDPFLNTIGSFVVRINFQQPVQAISFTAGGGGSSPWSTTEKDDIIADMEVTKQNAIRGANNTQPV